MRRDEDFTAYVTARWPTLVRSAVLLGCRPQDAEDLVQTTLAKCYRSWPRIQSAASPDAYVHRVLVNSHTDSRRRRWWGERASHRTPDVPEASDPVAEVDVRDAVDRALAGLSPQHRTVLVLRFFAHLSEAETAEALGLPLGTVKSRSSRALEQLAGDGGLADLRDRKST